MRSITPACSASTPLAARRRYTFQALSRLRRALGALSPFRSWDDSQINFRLTHLCIFSRDTIMRGHRDFQAAA